MKAHVWLLFVVFLISQISGAWALANSHDQPVSRAKSCGMSCCKLLEDLAACGCVEAPDSAPVHSAPMQTVPVANRVTQPFMTAGETLRVPLSATPPKSITARATSVEPMRGRIASVGAPVLFCSFLI